MELETYCTRLKLNMAGMGVSPLHGVGVLVTRPLDQSAELVASLEAAGASAHTFPVLEIVPFDPVDVEVTKQALPQPDIAIFISPNAVRHGFSHADGALTAAIGPATTAAIDALGHQADIFPDDGFDSEHLLETDGLRNVVGKTIRIIRGNGGRELLSRSLRARGATVHHLSVYERRRPNHDRATLQKLNELLHSNELQFSTVMSVESLRNLIQLIPSDEHQHLFGLPLVTPAARVIKECAHHDFIFAPILAASPRAEHLVAAIINHLA